MTRVAVTGADGFVGASVVRDLEGTGATVTRIVRRRTRPDDLICDLRDPSSVRALVPGLAGTDALVHVAAHVHRPRESEDEQREFQRVNVGGTAALVDAADAAGIRRLVIASTIGVYDFHGPVPDESAVPNPRTTYARTKLDGERAALTRRPDATIARIATVFGPGDRANFAKLARAVSQRRFVVPGDGSTRKSVIHVDDVASILTALATRATVPGLVHVASPEPLSIAEAADALAEAFEVMRPLRVPIRSLALAGRVGDRLAALGLPAPFDSTVLGKLVRDSVVDVARLLGFVPDLRFARFRDEAARSYGGRT